jgi:hypothetical protein
MITDTFSFAQGDQGPQGPKGEEGDKGVQVNKLS